MEMSNDNDNNNITTTASKGSTIASTQWQPPSQSPTQPKPQSQSQTTTRHYTDVGARSRSRSRSCSPLKRTGSVSDDNERQPNATANSIRPHGLLTDHESMMDEAEKAAKYSEDPDTKVGACLVDAQHRFVGTGYNQFPPNNSDRPYTWNKDKSDQLRDKRTYVLHAEAVAIMKHRTSNLRGATIYSTLMPCNECAKLIILAGIDQVYYLHAKEKSTWKYKASHRLLEAAGVKLTQLKK